MTLPLIITNYVTSVSPLITMVICTAIRRCANIQPWWYFWVSQPSKNCQFLYNKAGGGLEEVIGRSGVVDMIKMHYMPVWNAQRITKNIA